MPRCKFYASGLCKQVMTSLENYNLSTESKYFSTINDFVNDMLVLHTRLMQLICAFLSAFMCRIYVTCSHAFFSFFFFSLRALTSCTIMLSAMGYRNCNMIHTLITLIYASDHSELYGLHFY